MNIDHATHTSWAQLPSEARFLFILFFSGVFGPEELDRNAVVRELARIWDEEKLTLALLNDDNSFWALYRKYQEKYSQGVWRLEAHGISRKQAERADFIRPRAHTAVAHLCPAASRLVESGE